MKVNFSLKLTF